MRSKVPLAVAVFLSVTTIPLCAAGVDDKPMDMQTIQALEARATRRNRASNASSTPN